MMRKLLRYAAELGISVHGAHLEHGVLGEWYEDEREIYFDLSQTPDEIVFTIAHELGHAHHGDRCEDSSAVEARADIFAAQLLIDPSRYADLERAGFHQHDIAEDLGVTVDVLNLWMQACLVKLRGVTYTKSKMGVGQWFHRHEVAI